MANFGIDSVQAILDGKNIEYGDKSII